MPVQAYDLGAEPETELPAAMASGGGLERRGARSAQAPGHNHRVCDIGAPGHIADPARQGAHLRKPPRVRLGTPRARRTPPGPLRPACAADARARNRRSPGGAAFAAPLVTPLVTARAPRGA